MTKKKAAPNKPIKEFPVHVPKVATGVDPLEANPRGGAYLPPPGEHHAYAKVSESRYLQWAAEAESAQATEIKR